MIKLMALLSIFIFLQACSSLKVQRTGVSSDLDGVWIKDICMCGGKDDKIPNTREAHTMMINGDVLVQQLSLRWKEGRYTNYCTLIEETKIKITATNSLNLVTTKEKLYAPDKQECAPQKSNKSERSWQIIAIDKNELKFQSTAGCDNGPRACTYKRLDR